MKLLMTIAIRDYGILFENYVNIIEHTHRELTCMSETRYYSKSCNYLRLFKREDECVLNAHTDQIIQIHLRLVYKSIKIILKIIKR